MKYLPILLIAICLLPAAAAAAGQTPYPEGAGYGMMRGMAGYGGVSHDFMNDFGCPMMMNLRSVIDDYLRYKKELGLSPAQEKSFKDLRTGYQKDLVRLNSELKLELLDLRNLLYEDDIDLALVRSANAKVEKIQAEIRDKNIETFVAARKLLSEDQVKKARERGIRQGVYEYYNDPFPPMSY